MSYADYCQYRAECRQCGRDDCSGTCWEENPMVEKEFADCVGEKLVAFKTDCTSCIFVFETCFAVLKATYSYENMELSFDCRYDYRDYPEDWLDEYGVMSQGKNRRLRAESAARIEAGRANSELENYRKLKEKFKGTEHE